MILPLTFLGGVFYSVDVLPSPWHELSHFNPIFYLCSRPLRLPRDERRSVGLALGVTAALAFPPSCGRSGCSTGRKLKD